MITTIKDLQEIKDLDELKTKTIKITAVMKYCEDYPTVVCEPNEFFNNLDKMIADFFDKQQRAKFDIAIKNIFEKTGFQFPTYEQYYEKNCYGNGIPKEMMEKCYIEKANLPDYKEFYVHMLTKPIPCTFSTGQETPQQDTIYIYHRNFNLKDDKTKFYINEKEVTNKDMIALENVNVQITMTFDNIMSMDIRKMLTKYPFFDFQEIRVL